jgi:UDP-N-acetylglucosamine 1-carboxyvinyltransferase
MQNTDTHNIAKFIKYLREEKGISQEDFGEMLGTTQSAVARLESGEQNITLEMIAKVSEALDRKIISIPQSIDFQIEGGRKLSGSIETNTSKNGAISLICASLLNESETILHNVPTVEEVYRYIEIVQSYGVEVKWIAAHSISIRPPAKLNFETADKTAIAKTRSFMFVGSMIHKAKSFEFPHSGGCKMGERTLGAHKYGLEKLGVKIKTKNDCYEIKSNKLKAAEVVLYESSDTGAINVMLAAAKIPGTTTIKLAPPNYQVQDVCFFLQALGVKVEGIGSTTLKITGKEIINQKVEHSVSEDPIESMFFIAAGIVTQSTLTITRCPINFLELELEKLRIMGQKFKLSKKYFSYNGKTELVDITVRPSKLTALHDKIHTQPFPGLQNDNLPFFVPISILATGQTLVHDWTWENRAIYFTELNRLGAQVKLLDPHRVLVTGGTKLKGAQVVCPPALRPSAIILIAMLGATGTSTLRNVYSIQRGYANIWERLNTIGAKIKIIAHK